MSCTHTPSCNVCCICRVYLTAVHAHTQGGVSTGRAHRCEPGVELPEVHPSAAVTVHLLHRLQNLTSRELAAEALSQLRDLLLLELTGAVGVELCIAVRLSISTSPICLFLGMFGLESSGYPIIHLHHTCTAYSTPRCRYGCIYSPGKHFAMPNDISVLDVHVLRTCIGIIYLRISG
jgi:hypothetical protein